MSSADGWQLLLDPVKGDAFWTNGLLVRCMNLVRGVFGSEEPDHVHMTQGTGGKAMSVVIPLAEWRCEVTKAQERGERIMALGSRDPAVESDPWERVASSPRGGDTLYFEGARHEVMEPNKADGDMLRLRTTMSMVAWKCWVMRARREGGSLTRHPWEKEEPGE